jgi:hypothetical protein
VIWLSGVYNHPIDAMMPDHLGYLRTPIYTDQVPKGRIWAADSGIYKNEKKYRDDRYLSWLEGFDEETRDRCLFATAPDVVCDARATLARSLPMLEQIHALGYRPALVAQDGLENLDVPWDSFGALFVGGSTTWKLSEAAYRLVAEAHRRGKWTHMGRVNGARRLRAAVMAGYDSADGTKLAYGYSKELPKLLSWLELAHAPSLNLFADKQDGA